jgi:uncharacterized protein (TIGR01777 family)
MKILVSGASGLIGTELVNHLSRRGHDVTRLVRREVRSGEVRWNPGVDELSPSVVDGMDAVINLSGAGIGDRRWTAEYKNEILRSRVATSGTLACAIAGASRKPSVFLNGSAIGIYGARGDETLDENSSHGTGFLADVCEKWEAAAAGSGVRTVLLRTGIVLSPRGGALKKQLPLFKLGLGGRFGSGKQWQSWISIDDEVRAIEHLLTAPVTGAVNLTAPTPVTNAEFTRTLAKVVKRPALLPIPSFGPKLLLGAELADALLFTGQRVVPNVLTQSGFRFEHASLDVALRHLLKA